MRKNNPVRVHVFTLENVMIVVRGKRSVISTSKIKKIIAIRKNRSENGSRADPLGSNPHSKGDLFSRSVIVFFARSVERIITAAEMIRTIVIKVIEISIDYPGNTRLTDWKSVVLFILDNHFIILLISKLRYKGRVILHLRNVNIRQLLRIQNDGQRKNGICRVGRGRLIRSLIQ